MKQFYESGEVIGLQGYMAPLFIPRNLGFTDPREIGQALIAWRFKLSHDEVLLLELVATGLSNNQIAAQLDLAEEKTVKNRIHSIYIKLDACNRAEATRVAVEFGICREKVYSRRPDDSPNETKA